MISLRKTTLGLGLALFVCVQLVHAQQTDSAAKAEATQAELREKAFTVLESLADQLGSLQSPENRARIAANLAESLWTRDEKRARALFQLVQEDIKLGLQPRRTIQIRGLQDNTLEVFLKLREDTMRRLAKLDPELALAFLSDTFTVIRETQSYSDGTLRPQFANREKTLEAEVARLLARSNPEAALKLARKSLAGDGFEDGLLQLLVRLGSKNKDEARILHREIVNKIAGTNLKRNIQALSFSVRLAHGFIPPAADTTTFRELLNILLNVALESGCAGPGHPPLCYTIGPAVPLMAQNFPTSAARLKRWGEGEANFQNSYREVHDQLRELGENVTNEDILALAAKYPEMENEIVMQAVRTAEAMGDYERATKLATDYRGSPEVRQFLKERVAIYGIIPAEIAAQYSRLQQDLADEPPLRQLDLLLNFVNHVAPYDRGHAIKALNQARNLVDSLEPAFLQTGAQMAIAAMYCLAKSDQGFTIMEPMLPRLNELITAAAKLDGFNMHYLRDGEWNMSGEGELGRILNFLSINSGVFAWYDFDRAINLAAQFERPEIRMMAQLKLAQAILSAPPKRLLRS